MGAEHDPNWVRVLEKEAVGELVFVDKEGNPTPALILRPPPREYTKKEYDWLMVWYTKHLTTFNMSDNDFEIALNKIRCYLVKETNWKT